MERTRKYKREYPRRYALVARCLAAVKRADPQFPEASCPITSRLLCEVLPHCTLMCGYYHSAGKTTPHFWVFDMRARVHLDLTQAQFPGGQKGVVVYGIGERMEQYTLADVETFNDEMRISYFAKPMAEITVGTTTLARIARDVLR
jgi:hypothetical protein